MSTARNTMTDQHDHDGVSVAASAEALLAAQPGIEAMRQERALPDTGADFDLADVTMLTARLAEVMAGEIELLRSMNIEALPALQTEKLRLVEALEYYQKRLRKSPGLLQMADPVELAALQEVAQVFEEILRENQQELMVAVEVNHVVRQAIAEVANEINPKVHYDRKGQGAGKAERLPPVSLNEQI